MQDPHFYWVHYHGEVNSIHLLAARYSRVCLLKERYFSSSTVHKTSVFGAFLAVVVFRLVLRMLYSTLFSPSLTFRSAALSLNVVQELNVRSTPPNSIPVYQFPYSKDPWKPHSRKTNQRSLTNLPGSVPGRCANLIVTSGYVCEKACNNGFITLVSCRAQHGYHITAAHRNNSAEAELYISYKAMVWSVCLNGG